MSEYYGGNCSGAPCPTDYPLRSVSGRFGSAVVSRDCSCDEPLSHLLGVNPRARVFETLPTKKELRLWLLQSKVELGEFYFNGGSDGMMSTAGLELPYLRVSQAKFRDETSGRGK